MEKKGTILIVEDLLEEKIGKFKQILEIEGFKVKVAETYRDAKNELDRLIRANDLDGIILDFSFPIDDNDKSTVINEIPCGVQLFKDFKFNISLKGIPVIINTTGEEEYKQKYLQSIDCTNIPVYDVNNAATSLTQPTPEMIKQILQLFNDRYEKRELESTIKGDNPLVTGKSVIRDKDGNLHYARYDGD